jgi:hypothetical protein
VSYRSGAAISLNPSIKSRSKFANLTKLCTFLTDIGAFYARIASTFLGSIMMLLPAWIINPRLGLLYYELTFFKFKLKPAFPSFCKTEFIFSIWFS